MGFKTGVFFPQKVMQCKLGVHFVLRKWLNFKVFPEHIIIIMSLLKLSFILFGEFYYFGFRNSLLIALSNII